MTNFFSRYLWRKSVAPGQDPAEMSPAGQLKAPSGRFDVGFVDVEWEDPAELAVHSPDCKILGQELPCVLTRIFYPVKKGTIVSEKRGAWLPSSHYFPGYGYCLRIPSVVSSGLSRLLAAEVKIWAQEELPLISLEEFENQQLPCAIFSHGLAGIRTTYSALCCDLASRGMVIVALEHRDGSASMTIDQKGTVFPYKYGPSGTIQSSLDYDYRAAQLRHRIREIKSTLAFLNSINESGQFGALIAPFPFLKQFQNRLLIQKPLLCGHSFGACTVLAAAQEMPEVFSCIAWDPWMFPMPRPRLIINRRDFHLLVVLNEKFSSPENDYALQKFYDSFYSKEDENGYRFASVVMLQSGHMDQSDMASIIPPKLLQLIRPNASTRLNHHEILQANVDLAASYLASVFPSLEFDQPWSMTEAIQFHETPNQFDSETIKERRLSRVIRIDKHRNYHHE